MRIGVYPGSFDPFTLGHLDILQRCFPLFDKVVVGLLINQSKTPFFSVQERIRFVHEAAAYAGLENVEARAFDGLLIDFAREMGAGYIIRGLRAVTDFEYELQMSMTNKQLAPALETVFFMSNTRLGFISAGIVREVGLHGGDISAMVSLVHHEYIKNRLRNSKNTANDR